MKNSVQKLMMMKQRLDYYDRLRSNAFHRVTFSDKYKQQKEEYNKMLDFIKEAKKPKRKVD